MKTFRTHLCHQLSEQILHQTITLSGWVSSTRNHGQLFFFDLRDRTGNVQVVWDAEKSVSSKSLDLSSVIKNLKRESVIEVQGVLEKRPSGMENPSIPTGDFELHLKNLTVLSPAKTLPFSLEEKSSSATEVLRLKYRYLDLRRPVMQKRFQKKSLFIHSLRSFLIKHHFSEIETPILYKSTPEGARDFITPSRLNPGTFYALPQSPQTLKQLLMIAGMERYFQIARCFRDEDFRADRQPEFSQLDIEVSFFTQNELLSLLERMIQNVWNEVFQKDLSIPFPRISYQTSLARYGNDRPDTRFELFLQEVTGLFQKTQFRLFQPILRCFQNHQDGSIGALVAPRGSSLISRKHIQAWEKLLQAQGAKGLLWVRVENKDQLQGPVAKHFSEEEKKALFKTLTLKPQDMVFFVADLQKSVAQNALGTLRLLLGKHLKIAKEPWEGNETNFLWVTDFPLLEYHPQEGRYYAVHHPFTAVHERDREKFFQKKDLSSLQADAYDLVLNGVELGSGSARIFHPKEQQVLFEILGFSAKEAQKKFGFFLEALQYGTPPHRGIAFGLDRMFSLMLGLPNIREVIAFPKTQSGACLMSESPSALEPEQLAELGITLRTHRSS